MRNKHNLAEQYHSLAKKEITASNNSFRTLRDITNNDTKELSKVRVN